MDLIRNGGILFLFMLASLLSCQSSEKKDSGKKEGMGGEAIYQRKCASCHGKDGKKGLSGAVDLTHSELSMEERIKVIRNGRGAMIPFKGSLSKKEIRAVARYLDEFKKGE